MFCLWPKVLHVLLEQPCMDSPSIQRPVFVKDRSHYFHFFVDKFIGFEDTMPTNKLDKKPAFRP